MGGPHKHPPIPFRPPETDRTRLKEHARRTGQPVNAILTAALAAYLDSAEQDEARAGNLELKEE